MRQAAESKSPQPPHSLIVSSDRLVAMVVGKLLVELGYTPLQVGTGTEAVRTLRSRSVDLMVASYEGSPINGLALHDFLKESSAHRAIPFVLMVKAETRSHLKSCRRQPPAMLVPPFGQVALQHAIARAKDPTILDEGDLFEI